MKRRFTLVEILVAAMLFAVLMSLTVAAARFAVLHVERREAAWAAWDEARSVLSDVAADIRAHGAERNHPEGRDRTGFLLSGATGRLRVARLRHPAESRLSTAAEPLSFVEYGLETAENGRPAVVKRIDGAAEDDPFVQRYPHIRDISFSFGKPDGVEGQTTWVPSWTPQRENNPLPIAVRVTVSLADTLHGTERPRLQTVVCLLGGGPR